MLTPETLTLITLHTKRTLRWEKDPLIQLPAYGLPRDMQSVLVDVRHGGGGGAAGCKSIGVNNNRNHAAEDVF